MSKDLSGIFIEGLEQLGLDPRDEQLLAAFGSYRKELLDWNTRINLTAITDPQDVLLKHFLEFASSFEGIHQPRGSSSRYRVRSWLSWSAAKDCPSTVACNAVGSDRQKNALFAPYDRDASTSRC